MRECSVIYRMFRLFHSILNFFTYLLYYYFDFIFDPVNDLVLKQTVVTIFIVKKIIICIFREILLEPWRERSKGSLKQVLTVS